jgi:hypothetical protein
LSSKELPRAESLMEVLPLFTDGGSITLVKLGDQAMQVGWHADVHPNEVAEGLVREFGLDPIVAHSTSWRTEPRKLIITYIVIVGPADALAPMLRRVTVGRHELARGSAKRAPEAIDLMQVVEHGLRHLAWLQKDDPVIGEHLSETWVTLLRDYPPEPFRSFESGWEDNDA